MMRIKGVTLGVLDAIYGALNQTKPKGDEFMENAAFRKLVKQVVGVDEKTGAPKVNKDTIPADGIVLVMENSTFRYIEKVFKWGLDSGEVFIGSGSEVVAEAAEVLKSAEKVEKDDAGNGTEAHGAKNRLASSSV